MSLEKKLDELESLTKQLNSDPIDIDKSIKIYEKIVTLSHDSMTLLNTHNTHIEKLNDSAQSLFD